MSFRFCDEVYTKSTDAGILVVCGQSVLVNSQKLEDDAPITSRESSAVLYDQVHIENLVADKLNQEALLVGMLHDRACALIAYETEKEFDDAYQWVRLRELLPRLDASTYRMLARAVQLSRWQQEHQYCGKCGSKTTAANGEFAFECRNCEILNYPKISPCIMALIKKGEEVLLARGFNFPEGVYSTLAGFIEAGESLEHAIKREIREEVGIEVDNFQYFGSQTWPFPGQLMIGFVVHYQSGDIEVDGKEIEDAQWFNPSNLPKIPPSFSLSGEMIRSVMLNSRAA